MVDLEDVNLAFRKLKEYVYFDRNDLALRESFAEYECQTDLDKQLKRLCAVLSEPAPEKSSIFLNWLNEVTYRLVPKSIRKPESDDTASGTFLTNVSSAGRVDIEQVNYFIRAPIPIYLIAVIWLLRDGVKLDAYLGSEARGSRLDSSLYRDGDSGSALFKKYHVQYSSWRDSAIAKATEVLKSDRRSVAILGLDVREYFYSVRLDIAEIADAVGETEGTAALLRCVWSVMVRYREAVRPSLEITHPHLNQAGVFLPIGLPSSVVLGNWYLHVLDQEVLDRIRPAYYGRYVDDLLIVLPQSKNPSKGKASAIENFIADVFVRTGVFEERSEEYGIAARPGLVLRKSKCILQYFDVNHSIAGLDKFKKKLEANASSFLLLPVEEADTSLEEVAYELLYEGSLNKFRSVKGMAENRYELSKHLAKLAMAALLTEDKPNERIDVDLKNFFKGRNAIEFFDLWERVYTFYAVSGDKKASSALRKHLDGQIKSVRSVSEEITARLRTDLQRHHVLSRAMASALVEPDVGVLDLLESRYPIESLRRANLIRHQFVRRPLLNYTTFAGSLVAADVQDELSIDWRKVELTPRFLHLDECMMLVGNEELDVRGKEAFELAAKVYKQANRKSVEGVRWLDLPGAEGDETDGQTTAD